MWVVVCFCKFLFFLSLNFILWMVFIVGEKNRAVFFFPGTKYEVYKYFKQKIFFLNNWNWYHYFQVEDLSHQKVQCKLHSCLFVCFFFVSFFRYAWENSRHLNTPLLVSLWNGNSAVCCAGNLLQPIRCTTRIWIIKHHQYGISTVIPLINAIL